MEDSIAARRKAQKLARDGRVEKAIEAMDRVLEKGEVDPYDHVFRGDLLVRGQRLEDGINAFHEAVDAYDRVGLFRNAIAVGKKILRADPAQARTYQRLGELCAKEGLIGDSISHFLAFLDKSGGEVPGEEFVETLERVVTIGDQNANVIGRIAELYVRVGREDRAKEILEQGVVKALASDASDLAEKLRDRAGELMPAGGTSADEDPSSSESAETPAEPVLAIEPTSLRSEPGEEQADRSDAPEADGLSSLTDELRAACDGSAAPPADATEPIAPDPVSETEPAERSEPISPAQISPEEMPESIEEAEKLVADARELGDTLTTVRLLIHLGDLKIAAEDLEGALACFLEVLKRDPVNPTGRRRLARFQQMNVPGFDKVAHECRQAIQELIEMDGATVSVQEKEGEETDEWIDLTTLLQKFQDGVGEQVESGDYTGHYDLGLSHHEMGLFAEALAEFDKVLVVRDLPTDVEAKTREMRGICLCHLSRHKDAIEEYRAALEIADLPDRERKGLRYQLARALEEVGQITEACDVLRELAQCSEPLPEAKEHLARLGG